MRQWVVVVVAGVFTAALVAGFPASAADTSVSAVSYTGWSPDPITINVGDTVTWSNNTTYLHNVCIAAAGEPAGTDCNEFRNGDPAVEWSGVKHAFNAAGPFKYLCQVHTNMVGTVTVQAAGGGTTTPDTQTGTGTGTTPTGTQPSSSDSVAPRFTTAVKRRASRSSLVLRFGVSEDSMLKAVVSRRAPRAHRFAQVGKAVMQVRAGSNTVTLPRSASGRLRAGAYRVALVLVDAAGNRSAERVLVFKLAG